MRMNEIRRHVTTLLRASLLSATLAVGLLHAPPSQAQVVTAEAGPSLLAHLMNQLNTLTQRFQDYYQYGEEALRWKATWDHYTQQIAKFTSVVRNPALSQKVPFKKIAVDYGVAEKCGATGGITFSLAGLASSVMPNMDGNIVENQRTICTQIQMLENQKHNALVDYVESIAPVLSQDLQKISEQRAANNEQGTVQAIQEGIARLEAKQALSEEDLDNQVRNCDTMIAALTRMQQVLAQRALKGTSNPVIGTLVKTATLEAALKAGK